MRHISQESSIRAQFLSGEKTRTRVEAQILPRLGIDIAQSAYPPYNRRQVIRRGFKDDHSLKTWKDMIFEIGARRVPMSVDAFDRAFRRRMMIALSISVVLNAIVFGTASVIGHNFLHSLQILTGKKNEVTIRRVFIRNLPGGGFELVPDNGARNGRSLSSGQNTH